MQETWGNWGSTTAEAKAKAPGVAIQFTFVFAPMRVCVCRCGGASRQLIACNTSASLTCAHNHECKHRYI
eukprot:3034394-Amphidinium_carterae.1